MIPEPDAENHLCHVCGDYGTLWENGKWTCGQCRSAKPARTETSKADSDECVSCPVGRRATGKKAIEALG
jgi:hypothetical protein